MSPLAAAVVACAALAALCWVLSLLTREHSWVDRVWSLAPVGYVAWFAAQTGFTDPRLVLMMILAAAWGARLTYNFARKGGYASGGEDYRWAVLRGMMPATLFQAFNLVFIAAYQNALLLLISLPAWAALREEARGCTRCDLHRCGTQTVFGEGPLSPSIFFVGEQPGDQEDLAGRPFVGPAGDVFDAALQEAGIDRATTYVTNAVKHFKFVLRGKKRIHARPDVSEIDACRWWQEQERGLIQPALTVALGATAARSLTGKTVTISKVRDAPLILADGSECWITVHPSYLLRLPDADARRTERARFVSDLERIRDRAAALAA